MAEDGVTLPWTRVHPKVVAAAVVGGLVYVLGALGVDVGSALQDVSDVVGVDLPDQQALAVGLAAAIAGYLKKGF